MNARLHYAVSVEWAGDDRRIADGRRAFARDLTVSAAGKLQEIAGSADPAFFGDRTRWNPEELILASLSQCHLLSYLHVATRLGLTLLAYSDEAEATLERLPAGRGRMAEAVLRPVVTIAAGDDPDVALAAHAEAAELCFIAASVNFPVRHEPRVEVASGS
ncbi:MULTISPECIES: OsmC family protein [unclassified Salinibacterium]|uniref:OsmC family protein n=1 Tax=unclassified Salinibacterium TaxID=2632331 RepID=UPI00141EF848|nr:MULTISPECIES: OsmC family protein [unclassified Salinibacterium]